MATIAAAERAQEIAVGMGMSLLAGAPTRLTAILGSCIGVSVYCPRRQMGMLSHVVLPRARDAASQPAKYADTAVTHMRSELESKGVPVRQLAAKIVGGACMFGNGAFMQIGDANVAAAVSALQAAGIPVVACDVGGNMGRRISLDLTTGCVTVESVGRETRTI